MVDCRFATTTFALVREREREREMKERKKYPLFFATTTIIITTSIHAE